MNLPYFFLHSLQKMATAIQCKPGSEGSSLYHHALIKLLVIKELEKSQIIWFRFMHEKGFTIKKYVHPSIFPELFSNHQVNVSIGESSDIVEFFRQD